MELLSKSGTQGHDGEKKEMIAKVTRMKIPTFDMTRVFPIYLEIAKGGLGRANNQLFLLYIYVLKLGWSIYKVVELKTCYNVWIAKQGQDHKCIILKAR